MFKYVSTAPLGSESINSTFFFFLFRAYAIFTADIVLPEPPLGLPIVIIFIISPFLSFL